MRSRLITFFYYRKCLFPEDLADETINRVTLKIEEEKIGNKQAYIYGVAKFVYLESLRKEKNHLNIDEVTISENVQKYSDDCLEKCLNELSEENREVLLDYYSEEKQAKIKLHNQLSEKLNLTKTALRMKLVRLKRKLKICLEECAS
ncbi:MAG: hypothetical protein LUM44_07560 [Pyrinomonadaceae bacterium]|nr:hypothetical protein [Pyrinomonadaceae bacterium]